MLDVDLCVTRREFSVDVSFDVSDGECFALFGPSGSGKTTILEAIAGIEPVRRGAISLGGVTLESTPAHRLPPCSVPVWQRAVALLRQDPALFPHLRVEENITYARGARDPERLRLLAARLQLEEVLQARPGEISGGQAHRVALARALAAPHRALLLDEPFSGLDEALRRELIALVRTEVRAGSIPAVLVAHELADAQAFGDRLGVLDRGRLLQIGTPSEVVRRPESRRVAELVGYRAFVTVGVADGAGDRLTAAVHPDRVVLGAHPELGPVLEGRAVAARPAGSGWELDVMVGAVPVPIRTQDPTVQVGAVVHLSLVDPPLLDREGSAVAPRPTAVRP